MANAIYTIDLAIRSADADNCPQNLGNFGVGTDIKSILLTLRMVWGGSLRCKLPDVVCGRQWDKKPEFKIFKI